MDKHADYYQGHDMIRSAFGFLKKTIEAWYLTEDSENNKMQLQRKSVCFCGAVLQKCDMALFFLLRCFHDFWSTGPEVFLFIFRYAGSNQGLRPDLTRTI